MKPWFSRVAVGTALLAVAVVAACAGGSETVTPSGASDAGPDVVTVSPPSTADASSTVGEDSAAPPSVSEDSGSSPILSEDAGTPPPVDLAPSPTLASIAPASAIVGTPAPTITCTGTGFVARSVVQVDGVPLTTTFVSATELEAALPASDMSPVGSHQVTVGTSPPGGGGSAAIAFDVVNPAPTLTALSPTSAVLAAPNTPLTVTGTAFVAGATIAFGGTPLTTTVTKGTSATATIPAASLTASGVFPVTITNPAPGGGASSSIAFIVSNPSVTITSVTPSSLTIDGPAASIALVGTGFVAASAVSFNGAPITTTYTNATHLGATIPASALTKAGAFPVAVTNPAPGGGTSTPVTVNVVYPAPTATSLSPTSALLGASPPTLTVTGSGFLAGATAIALDGAPLATTVLDATHAQAMVTTTEMSAAHVFQVTVTNPTPGGGTSSPALSFTVNNPAPAAASVSPPSALVGAANTTVTIAGSGFVPASTALVGSAPIATTYVSATTLTAVVPASDLTAVGALSLFVTSPAPGGGTSSPALSFGVDNPAPTATSVAPSFALVGAADTAITVTGSGFVSSSSVLLGTTPLATTFVSATTLTSTIPAANLTAATSLALYVTTPAPGGGSAGPLAFTVDNEGPSITSVTPSSTIVPSADTPITVAGSGFSGVSVVQMGTTPLATTFSGGSLDATIPAASLASATTLSLTVVNPPPGGGTSNVAYFTANDPLPVLAAVSPTQIYALSGATPITLTGSGFVAASVVQVNGAPVTVTAQTSTSITATVPATLLAAPTTLTVDVMNPAPGGGTSASQTIGVVCNTSAASVVFSALSTPQSFSLSFTGAPTAYRITQSEYNYTCPSSDDTSGTEPYLTYVVVNDTSQSATLSAWAVCSGTKEEDAFLTFYAGSTVPTTQNQLESCATYVAEGYEGAGGFDSPSPGESDFCPGLTKSNGGGLTLPACGTAVVLVQPYSATSSTYPPPPTLTLELQ